MFDDGQRKSRPCKCPNRDRCIRNCRSGSYKPSPWHWPHGPPPPPPTPLQALPPRQNHDDNSMLVTGVTIMGSMLCSALILCIFFALVRFYFNKRIDRSRRTGFPVGFFGSRDDFFLREDQILPHFDNPIWYINTIGLQQSVIDSIMVFKFKKDERLIEGTECSVCLSEFQEDESLRLLPNCSHGFHLPCIDTWLRSHQNCPLCRAPVVSDAMVAQTSASGPNSISTSGSSNETIVENNVGEGGTCGIEDGNTRGNSRMGDSDGTRATRRSVSLDLTCSMEISGEARGEHEHGTSLDTELDQLEHSKGKIGAKRSSKCKLMKSSSSGRYLSKGAVSMKRSFSSGGKFLLSKRHGSILPL